MKGQSSLQCSKQGAYSWDTKSPRCKGEQDACSFRCSLHHILDTTGLTSGVGVCCSEGIKNDREAVKMVFLWHIKLVDYAPCN